jgi:hypothetical protein
MKSGIIRFEFRMSVRVLVVTAALLLAGCARRFIPGTEIEDNEDTAAIVALMEKYRVTVEGRDAEALMTLVSPQFRDNQGTSTPEDDLDYRSLPLALKDRFGRVDDVRLSIDVKNIEVQKDDAAATYYWTMHWRAPGLSQKPQVSSELKRMHFQRVERVWKIVSGI